MFDRKSAALDPAGWGFLPMPMEMYLASKRFAAGCTGAVWRGKREK